MLGAAWLRAATGELVDCTDRGAVIACAPVALDRGHPFLGGSRVTGLAIEPTTDLTRAT